MSRSIARLGVVAMILGAVLYVLASIWSECREDHSFFYCMRLMSR